MKKTILVAAFMLAAMSSCQDKTKEKIEDSTEAVGNDIKENVDTAVAKVDTAITTAVDTIQSKTGKALEKGAKKMDEAADKLKEDAKK